MNDRLIEVVYPDKTTTYTYDAAYNRIQELTTEGTETTETTEDKTYGYNNRNQVTEVTDNLDPSNTASYSYDANGNRISKTQSSVIIEFDYDVRDQLRQITQGGSSVGQFLYDYQGLRIRKQTQTESIRYVYDDQSVLLQTDDLGNTVAKYDYGPDKLLSLNHTTQGAQFYLFDSLGSVVNLTRPDGAIQARYQYDAWGNVRNEVGSSENPFGFTGHEMDQESGLIYMKARFYDPELGLFLNEDGFEGNVDTPPSLHRYLYAFGNPVVFIDPDGYESVTTMIDNAAEGCNAVTCAGWALLQGVYQVGTLGFASVHDPVRDAYDRGEVSGGEYVVKGIGGGGAAVGVTVLTGRAATPFLVAANSTKAVVAVGAATGIVEGAAVDAITQTTHISAGLQEEYDVSRTVKSAALGGLIGGGAAGGGKYLNDQIELRQQTQKLQQQPKEIIEASAVPGETAIPQTTKITAPISDAVGDSVGAARVRNSIIAQGAPIEKPIIKIEPYKDTIKSNAPGQAHHLSQDAVFKSVIPTNEGLSIKLEGNAFTEIGSPHYSAHRILEDFYNQFRRGGQFYGEIPTNLQYNRALLDSLQGAGLTREQALEAVRQSIRQRIGAGQLGGIEIPRIPKRINQVKPK